jgi:hypothetical protein
MTLERNFEVISENLPVEGMYIVREKVIMFRKITRLCNF